MIGDGQASPRPEKPGEKNRPDKPRLAMYWASACGGCEVSVINIADRLLMLDKAFHLVFCPCLVDFKLEDVRAFADGSIDLCLFNGNIRSTENEMMARLLRDKSRFLVAYGSCAHEGCVPGLANLSTAGATLRGIYRKGPTTDNPSGTLPQVESAVPEGTLTLPALFDTVRTLDQVVPVDFTIPGCPPESPRVWEALELFIEFFLGRGGLPDPGAVLGAGTAAVCEECPRTKPSGRVERFRRRHEVVPDAATCLLDQGLICMGVATRQGCGALCPRVNMGCEGCYGPPEGVQDVGARMVAALAGMIGAGDPARGESHLREQVEAAMRSIPDPAGTFYRFSLAHSLLRRARRRAGDDGSGETA